MLRTTYWSLTVKFWKRAVEAGVRPIDSRQAPNPYAEDPALYTPHVIEFEHPPSREDLTYIVSRVAWMHLWEKERMPIIAANHWPMIDSYHKASSVDLLDEQGRVVGELRVQKEQRWVNEPYHTYPIRIDERDKAVKGLRGEALEAALKCIRANENFLREKFVDMHDEGQRVLAMKSLLHEKGLLKKKPGLAKSSTV